MKAVSDVSFAVRPHAICGWTNGSGKSTTIKMITSLLPPSTGMLYSGQDIREELVGYKAMLGFVPEEPHLNL
ncbi:MAG TPA: ATP-binding cassette domain-containing protein [Acidobacteriaceae bacterium]|nr:ATP-binding cassette domain-containing protein [Acidobacteriaceae bacterium]